MENERDEEDEINLTNVFHASSADSLDQSDAISATTDSLGFVGGYRKWVNSNDKIRVNKTVDHHVHPDNHKNLMIPNNNNNNNNNDDDNSMHQKTLSMTDAEVVLKNHSHDEEEDEDNYENSLSHMDVSLNQFDGTSLPVHHEIQQMTHQEVFSSTTLNHYDEPKKMKLNVETLEMDTENGHYNTSIVNECSRYSNQKESYRSSFEINGSSNNNNNNSDGSNPNRNDNHSRESDGDGSEGNDGGDYHNHNNNNNDNGDDDSDDDSDDDNDDDDDDDEDNIDDETDEGIARRLGFLPINNKTLLTIGRLRMLTNKHLFDRRDFEFLQSLIDELIQLQHLEHYSRQQLKEIVRHLKLYRPLQKKSRALIFLQERIPRRAVKYSVISIDNEHNSSVFDIWRERERRARLDSKDSLEEEDKTIGGQQLRDVSEINHPTPPILLTSTNSGSNLNLTSKVKQMARNIDTRSTSTRSEINLRTVDRFSDHAYIPRSSSPTYPGVVSVALYDVKSRNDNDNDVSYNGSLGEERIHSRSMTTNSTNAASETSRVRQMINRLESSSSPSTSSAAKSMIKSSIKKSLHDDHSDGSGSLTSSPPVKRFAQQDYNEKSMILLDDDHTSKENFHMHSKDYNDNLVFQNEKQSNEIIVEINQPDCKSESYRKNSGTTIEEYVTTLHSDTETSLSMVRDVRARVYDDESALPRKNYENIPIKVEVETLYIIEEKSDKKSHLSSSTNIHIPDYEVKRSAPAPERHDFAMQTTGPTLTIKPSYRPVGTQVETSIELHTVAAQTTDSLHRPMKERQRLPSISGHESESKKVTTATIIPTQTTVTTRYEIKRRHSSHYCAEDDDNDGAVIYISDQQKKSDFEENFELKRERNSSSNDSLLPSLPDQRPSFGQVTARLSIEQLRDINRHVVNRHVQGKIDTDDEHRSSEVYEIHTRGACKCVVVSYEEKQQQGSETRFENQLKRIERSYTDEELKLTDLHVIVTSSDKTYELVKRDYGLDRLHDFDKENICEKSRTPTITIHYYTKEGHHMRTEFDRRLEHLPLVIRCEIEYELNHYGSAHIVVLSVTSAERRQLNISLKKEIVDEIVARSGGRLSVNSPELEQEITRQLAEPTTLIHLVDYSSREDYYQTNSTDLRRVSRIDVSTSLRLVQRYRTVIHRLCQQYRSSLRLSHRDEQQRYMVLISRDEYYMLDLANKFPNVAVNMLNIQQRQHDIFKREVNNVIQQPFDYEKYRRELQQQQHILQQQCRQRNRAQQIFKDPPPPGHPSEAEFYLGAERRVLIERAINSMRQSMRPHEHASPCYQLETKHRSLSLSYLGGQRYARARIIHLRDFYDGVQQYRQTQNRQVIEQELFVRVDDHVNQAAANVLRRSYSSDYIRKDGPRSRIRYIRIPGQKIKAEEKKTHAYKGVMYADLPYSLKYWNILYILDREARQGRPLGSTLPQVIVNDPYTTVIPPLTQQEIRQTAEQILSPNYNGKSYTDQTLRWFLSRDNRTEIESAKCLETLNQYRFQEHQHQQQQKHQSQVSLHDKQQIPSSNDFYITEKLIRYDKLPDRLVPIAAHERCQSTDGVHSRRPSIPHILQPPDFSSNFLQRPQSQPHPCHQSSMLLDGSNCPTPQPHKSQQSQRVQLPLMSSPLSRHQSVYELHAAPVLSHPPSPSPSLHSFHQNHNNHIRRPVSYNNRFPLQQQQQQQQHQHQQQQRQQHILQQKNAVLTEIIDSQTGRRFFTTSQEQLPTEVLGLLNKYNLQKF